LIPRATDTVYVAFQDLDRGAWWDGFCIPGFRHCWIMRPTYSPARGLAATQSTLKIEPVADYFHVEHWQKRTEDAAREINDLDETTAVVSIRATLPPPEPTFPRGIRGIPTCVSMVKYALGLRAWSVWTPKHLCDYLVLHQSGKILERRSRDDDRAILEAEGA